MFKLIKISGNLVDIFFNSKFNFVISYNLHKVHVTIRKYSYIHILIRSNV